MQQKAGPTAVAEQSLGHAYPEELDREEDGGFVCYCARYRLWGDAGRHLRAEDMLDEAILGMIAHSEDAPLPSPAKGRPVMRLPALTAAKLELYRAMREAGLDAAQLAHRLGWPPKKIGNILDGYHVVHLEQLEAALNALGRRLVVTSEAA